MTIRSLSESSSAENIVLKHLEMAALYRRWAAAEASRPHPDSKTIENNLQLAHEAEVIAANIDLGKPIVNGKATVALTIDSLAMETSRYLGRIMTGQTARDYANEIHDDINDPNFIGYSFKGRTFNRRKAKVLIFPNNSANYANRQLKYAESYR